MELRQIAETSTTFTLGWDQVPNAEWYLFYADGRRLSNAPAIDKNGNPKVTIKFLKGDDQYEVVAMTRVGTMLYGIDAGLWNATPTPPPGGIAPPEPPFTVKQGDQLVRAFAQGTSPGVTEHIHVTSSPFFGLLVMQWPPAEWAGRYTVRDVKLENTFSDPIDVGGTDEANLWAGQTGDYYRFVCRNAEWMGIFTGSRCWKSKLHDFQVLSQRNVGVYLEHVTVETDFFNFNVESNGTGFNEEWTYHNPIHSAFYAKTTGLPDNGRAGSALNRIFDGRIRTSGSWSIYVDAGGFGNRIAMDGYLDVNKPMRLPRQLADPSRPNQINEANINWNGIPEGQRIFYHDDPMGVYKVPRFSFGLRRGRIEGLMPHRRILDWEALGKQIGLSTAGGPVA